MAPEPASQGDVLPLATHAQAPTARLEAITLPVAIPLPRARGTGPLERFAPTAPEPLRLEDVAHVAHDFKDPLATIALEAWLLGDKAGALDADVKAAALRIARNAQVLDRMVHDLLDAAAFDAGALALHVRGTDVRALLEHVIERAVPSRDRDRVFLESPRGVVLSIDDLRIERVVANLLSNALKYGSRSAGVVVRLEADPGERVRISVLDAGPGLTAEQVSYVFLRYRRAPSASGARGTGLGLFTSKVIVEAHGGCMGVASVPGTGSCFYFELPAA